MNTRALASGPAPQKISICPCALDYLASLSVWKVAESARSLAAQSAFGQFALHPSFADLNALVTFIVHLHACPSLLCQGNTPKAAL